MSSSEFTHLIVEPTVNVAPARPNTIGFYAMPIMANLNNTGDRIQNMVDRTGIPFIMSDLFAQTKRQVFGYTAKDANQVHGDIYREMSQRRLDFVRDTIDGHGNYATVLAMGDSLGVPAVQGMQLHAAAGQGFEALLLRDGWNLSQASGKLRGLGRYGLYQVKDVVHGLKNNAKPDIPEYGYADRELDEDDETKFYEKLVNVADTMRGPENRTNAILLAGRAASADQAVLNLVVLRQGLSGKPNELATFVRDTRSAYNNAARDSALPVRQRQTLRAEIVDGWHSDLLDPARGATDVQNTLKLL